MKNRLTIKSKNKKTGPIPVSTTERKSCPKSCPFKKNGCYADGGPLAIVWDQTATTHGRPWSQLCKDVAAMPDGQLWRHNQAGDLPHKKQTIDMVKMDKLVEANKGKKGFTYTHHTMDLYTNRIIVSGANDEGFTVNLSANNLDHADNLKALNIGPIVVVLPESQTKNLKTPAGNKVTVCPAAIDKTDKINCANCGLCAIADRETIIGFPAHGMRKRHAGEIAQG
jgi:hypothetical protein